MNNDHNISNEDNDLNGMAPKLSKLSSNNPFNPSNDYFNSFTSKLQNRIEDEEEIKALAPTLLSINKYNPFEVPKDYFEELPSIIQEKVVVSKERTGLLDWLFWLLRPRFAVSMTLILFISVIGIYYINKNNVKNIETMEELSLEDNLYYINENDIVEHLTADASIELDSYVEDENSIENYLIDNNIEESKLSNEL